MRMRTATVVPLSNCPVTVGTEMVEMADTPGQSGPGAKRERSALLLFFLPLLRPLARTLPMPRVSLSLDHPLIARVERPHLRHPGHHLDPLPDGHGHHLLHQGPDGVELLE